MKNLQLPFGVQDYMPQECYNKNSVQDKLCAVFALHGLSRVSVPAIEYFDVYGEVLSRSALNKTFKMTDIDGSLLMLRADPTLQICRMAASKLNSENIKKVYYIENSYEYISDPTAVRSREFPQAGVEILGDSGSACDAEALIIAIESLLGAGLEDFMLEIGQVDYFNGIALQSGFCEKDAAELRLLINRKDMLGIEMFLNGKNVSSEFRSQFMLLPTLFGDTEILKKARADISNEKSLRALDNLEDVMSVLKAAKLDKYVSIDLGLLRGEYYTGIVVKGLYSRLGVPILDGGRYDKLCDAFGVSLPAVGFSVGVKRLLTALEKEGKLLACKPADCAYISDGDNAEFEYSYISELRKKGLSVEKCFFKTEKQLIDYCNAKNIDCAAIICGGKIKFAKGKV